MISVAKYLSPMKNTNTNRKIASASRMESKAVGLKILTTKTNNHSLILLQRNQIIPSTSYNYSHHPPPAAAAETCFLKTCFLCHKHLSPNKDIYMYSSTSSSSSDHHHDNLYHIVDEQYFSALHDDDEVFPISDEKYAQELQLQEALFHSSSNENQSSMPSYESSSSSLIAYASSSSSSPSPSSSLVLLKNKGPLMESKTICQELLPGIYCGICMDSKTEPEMFRNTNVCSHVYCNDCICQHVATTIKQNLPRVNCPDPKCKCVIGPEVCRNMVPKQVLDRWEDVLCESLIMGSQKYYCPFKDCSAMLVDDGGVAVTCSECPNCNRLFCAQCRVAWHCGMDCSGYKSLKNGERDAEDLMLMDLAKNKKWMRCPSCKFYVEKISGCLHISCRCGHHFCYECGKQNDGTSHTCAHF